MTVLETQVGLMLPQMPTFYGPKVGPEKQLGFHWFFAFQKFFKQGKKTKNNKNSCGDLSRSVCDIAPATKPFVGFS
jgi:hypothetical protein